MHYLILGNCAAGIKGIEGIRTLDKKGTITVVSLEPEPAYTRCLITNYLLGTHSERDLILREVDFYQKNGVRLILGKKAVRVFPGEKKVELEDGEKILYDKLLISTGSSPKKLKIKGEEKEGVFGFRTLEDARRILERSKKSKKALIFGGGLIGLKAGYALKKRGLEVEVIVKSPRILSQVVDEKAAEVISRWLQEFGIKIRTGVGPTEIVGKEDMEGAILENGEKIKAELGIVGKGVAPNLSFLKASGINTHWGVIVDERLRTNIPGVFAAGDVAEAKDLVRGEYTINALWMVAQEEGRIAGINMAGGEKIYPGSIGANAAEFFGLPFISMGRVREKEGVRVREIFDPRKFIYKRLVFKEDKLIGAVFVGEVKRAGMYMGLIRNKISLKGREEDLLEGWMDYGQLRELLEREKGFRESLTCDGEKVFFP